jgi:phosphoserine phosphatase/adenylate kinase
MILGVYGISGVGKTALCHVLSEASALFRVVDGSALMDELIPGGLEAFKRMSPAEKYQAREIAVQEIGTRYRNDPKHTLVSGHYSFLQPDGSYDIAWTDADGEVYDHILCLDADAGHVGAQCLRDMDRPRTSFSEAQLSAWQDVELTGLKSVCAKYDIPLSVLSESDIEGRMVEFFKHLSRQHISDLSGSLLGEGPHDFAVFDCDGTLFAGDCLDYLMEADGIDSEAVCSIFKRRDEYCFESFFDVARYYATSARNGMGAFIERAAESIILPPDTLELLARYRDTSVVWITSGFPEIWEAVARRYGIEAHVIGGNDFTKQATIVSNEEKALFVQLLTESGAHVTAFGDSMADAGMLNMASEAVVVVSKKWRYDLFDALKSHPHVSSIDLRHTINRKVCA